jgi:hypothetical protein
MEVVVEEVVAVCSAAADIERQRRVLGTFLTFLLHTFSFLSRSIFLPIVYFIFLKFLRVMVAYFLGGGAGAGAGGGGGSDYSYGGGGGGGSSSSSALKAVCDSLLDEVLLSAGKRCSSDPFAWSMAVPDLVAKSNAAVAEIGLLSAS